MKIRRDFVTNSSSSSFLISMDLITAEQSYLIRHHQEVAEEYGLYCDPKDAWEIEETTHIISGRTFMDNFDMDKFLIAIGIPEGYVYWENT
jgi:hypothetical protein